jgi:hypothetical protein
MFAGILTPRGAVDISMQYGYRFKRIGEKK